MSSRFPETAFLSEQLQERIRRSRRTRFIQIESADLILRKFPEDSAEVEHVVEILVLLGVI